MRIEALLPALLADPARPRVTWYDEGTGERIELSGRVLANWVAKAGNWLQDEADVSVGTTLGLRLPTDHWRCVYWALAGWACGTTVLLDADAEVTVGFADAELVEPTRSLSPSPLMSMPDVFTPYVVPAPTDAALGTITYADLIRPAGADRELLEGDGVETLRRVLDLLAADGSVVLVRNATPQRRAEIAETEGATAG
ncbi:TIGR03089 family protein [Calidifontibacter sp. DB0510]|uniref:TIGR03089 family protein n=1 Tax=Metallococcus carri TaxID=1656884 RepID=A0A967AZR8_9MICO|nr:TIGR03089 family protein [Metallococcus carri]NHN54610.1 TIGR03089 family protein [Metallococcus carri]NOP36551.1 TIGR03089 family protein [Calidifontibacter sp. DB2511S]